MPKYRRAYTYLVLLNKHDKKWLYVKVGRTIKNPELYIQRQYLIRNLEAKLIGLWKADIEKLLIYVFEKLGHRVRISEKYTEYFTIRPDLLQGILKYIKEELEEFRGGLSILHKQHVKSLNKHVWTNFTTEGTYFSIVEDIFDDGLDEIMK